MRYTYYQLLGKICIMALNKGKAFKSEQLDIFKSKNHDKLSKVVRKRLEINLVHYKLFNEKFDIKDPNTIVYKIDGGNFAIYTNESDSKSSDDAANALTKKLISKKISEDVFKFYAPYAPLPKSEAATIPIKATTPMIIPNQNQLTEMRQFIPPVYQITNTIPQNNVDNVESNATTPLMLQQQQFRDLLLTQLPINTGRQRGTPPK